MQPLLKRPVIALLAALAFSGCSDGQDAYSDETEGLAGETSLADNQKMRLDIDFLTMEESVEPADWLIYKVYGVDPAEYVGREEIRELLLKLNSHYTESTRMLANRTMQTFKMLAENDLSIELERFLADFATIPSEGTMTVYGSYCQHYFNLRAQGAPHEAAVQNIIAERLRANPR